MGERGESLKPARKMGVSPMTSIWLTVSLRPKPSQNEERGQGSRFQSSFRGLKPPNIRKIKEIVRSFSEYRQVDEWPLFRAHYAASLLFQRPGVRSSTRPERTYADLRAKNCEATHGPCGSRVGRVFGG